MQCELMLHIDTIISSLQNKCQTGDPDRQNLRRSGKLSFSVIYKFCQNCAAVRQVSNLILKTDNITDQYLSTDIKSILWYPSFWYISLLCFSGFAASILQKNTANTIWLDKIVIYILNITMIIFISPHFWESGHLPDESQLKIAQILPKISFLCLYISIDISSIHIIYQWIIDTIYIASRKPINMQH